MWGWLPDLYPVSPATVFFLPTVFFYQLQWAPHGMESPLSGTCEAGWRASGMVGLLSGTCEAGWRASSLVGSGSAGCGSATNGTPGTVRRGVWRPRRGRRGSSSPPCCPVGDPGRLEAAGVVDFSLQVIRLADGQPAKS